MKKGKSTNQAIYRTLANKDLLNFATKRILRDLEEIQNEKIPTVGVIAMPLEKNLFIWHCNLKGPVGTQYEGGVFHFELQIPNNYPLSPPKCILFTTIPHPNVFDNTICLDMLQEENWSTAYTIQSILLQLQSFLFEKQYFKAVDSQIPSIQFDTNGIILKAIESANQYSCSKCKHGGKLAAWPQFNPKETQIDSFIMLESEIDLFRKYLKCFHTKMSYEETQIGLGLKISKVPRTGSIKQVNHCLDYISVKAFLKEGVRKGVDKEAFTHWIPLYFGFKKDQVLHLLRHSLSMIFTNNTRQFKPSMILEFFPKYFTTLTYMIMDEKRHPSIRYFNLLAHIHALFLLVLNEYPEVIKQIDEELEKFLKDETLRHKDNTPNLGQILFYLFISEKYQWSQFQDLYTKEQLTRQVFWLLLQIPEFGDESLNIENEKRNSLTFKCEITGYHITCFYKMITKFLKQNKTNKQLLEEYEKNFCKLTNEKEEFLQKQCFKITKIDSFEQYFEFLEIKKKSSEEITKLLIQSIKDSKDKKYHGTDDEIMALPSTEEQIAEWKKDLPKLEEFIDTNNCVKKNVTEDEWKKALEKRYPDIALFIKINKNSTPFDVIKMLKENIHNCQDEKQDFQNRPFNLIKQKFYQKDHLFENRTIADEIESKFTWKQLFIKTDIEEHILLMDFNPDFKNFYNKLKVFHKDIISLRIPLFETRNLKSNSFYLAALLTECVCLENIEFYCPPLAKSTSLTLKILKNLNKGFKNMNKNNCNVRAISFSGFDSIKYQKDIGQSEYQDALYQFLFIIEKLSSLSMKGCNLLNAYEGGQQISKFLSISNCITELSLQNNQINDKTAKDLADGIMRAKFLSKLDLSNNPGITNLGLSNIIYNLAFSPKLEVLNISQSTINEQNGAQIIESIYKLLRISGSLQTLIMNRCNNLTNYFNLEFFKSIGEIRTLKYIDYSFSGNFTSGQIEMLGKAIALNAKKHGTLEVLHMFSCIKSNFELNQLYKNMNISEYDHENWYGDSHKASKMSGTELQKIFYNNLRVLNFAQGNKSLKTNFNMKYYKQQYQQIDSDSLQLFNRSKNLESLSYEMSELQKNDADFLYLILDQTRPVFANKIKYLNLSKNNIGKDGCKVLATIFEINTQIEYFDISSNKIGVSGAHALSASLIKNKTLKTLNLFGNNIDVDGARSFGKLLKTNNSLEFIDFGHNRLRDEGLSVISDGILSNKTSNIQILGLTFNFITETSVKKLLTNPAMPKSHIKELFLSNNGINELGLYQIKEQYDEKKLTLHIDIFQKLIYSEPSRLNRTIWIFSQQSTLRCKDIQNFLDNAKCGIIINIQKKKGKKWPNRNTFQNVFFLVEFASTISVSRSLKVASRRIDDFVRKNQIKIYKAGSGTYLYQKEKKNADSKTNVLDNTRTGIQKILQEKRETNQHARGDKGDKRGRGGYKGRGRGRRG